MFSKRRGPSTNRRARLRLLVVAGCLTGGLAPATAQAAVDLQVKPPTLANAGSVAVGDTATGELTIANGTTAPQDTQNFVLTEITLVPSCGAPSADKYCVLSPGGDPGVITIGDTATGSGACSGKTFTVSVVDIASGRVTFTPSAEVSLASSGPGATCVITFTYTVNKMATKDTGAASGMQTDLVAWAQGYALVDPVPRKLYGDQGTADAVSILKDTPELVTRASQAVNVGGELSVAGTLTGTHPDGNITFNLFDPTDPSCTGLPAQSNTLTVNGNGTYRSPVVTATQAGTYRWTASYDGDGDNAGVDSACSEPAAATVVSTPASPPLAPPSIPGGGGTTPGGGGTTPGGVGTTPGGGGTTPVGGATNPGTVVKRVRLDAFALTRRTFARATRTTVLAANAAYVAPAKKKKATAKGTTIKYTLSAPATVTLVVERVTKGRRAGGYANKCVTATAKLKKKKAKVCTLYTKVSTLKRVYRSGGAKKVAFSGRAGRKVLPAGSYRLRAKAAAGAGTASAERKTTFRIVRR